MKLTHIGLNVQSKEELVDFYQNILDFHLDYQFNLDSVLTNKIFGIREQIEIFLYTDENMKLELFVCPEPLKLGFSHICVEVTDRDMIVHKGKIAGYPVIRIERNNKPDMLFIRDKSGNVFELQNQQNV